MFYLGRNDELCEDTLSVIIQFLLCGCLYSKTNKVQSNIYVIHKIGTNTPLIIGGFHMK